MWANDIHNLYFKSVLSWALDLELPDIFTMLLNINRSKTQILISSLNCVSPGFHTLVSNITHFWRRAWQPTPVFLPEESHGQRSLVGYSPWGHKESDTNKRLSVSHTFSLPLLLSPSPPYSIPQQVLLAFPSKHLPNLTTSIPITASKLQSLCSPNSWSSLLYLQKSEKRWIVESYFEDVCPCILGLIWTFELLQELKIQMLGILCDIWTKTKWE